MSKVTVDRHLMIYKLPIEVAIACSLSDHDRQIDRLLTTDFDM